MAEYFTEAAYMRWYRQYQISIGFYVDVLDDLRARIEELPYEDDQIQSLLDEIDQHIERAAPRNFYENGEPLVGFEKFLENMRVLVNLICHQLKKPDKFFGIYREEKSRVAKIHQEYKFKDKINQLKAMIEAAEFRIQQEQVAPEAVTVG